MSRRRAPGRTAGFGHHELDQRAEGAPAGRRVNLVGGGGGVRGGVRHYEPPEVAWLPPPELELGREPELKPPELEPEFEELVKPEPLEPGASGA